MVPLFGDKAFYKNLFTLAIPIMLQNFINSLVNMLDTIMIGRLGTVEIAAVGLGNQIFFLYNLTLFEICSGGGIFTAQFWGRRDYQGIRKNAAFNITGAMSMLTWVIFMGLGNGVAVLIGKKIGEGDEKAARACASRIVRFAPLVSLGAAGILFLLSFAMPAIFKVNEETLILAAQMFIILCLSYPFRAFNMSLIVGICRAGGDTVFCMFCDTVILWFIALPLAAAAAFVFRAPVWGIYACLCGEEVLKMLLGLWRLKTGRWLHHVTEGI